MDPFRRAMFLGLGAISLTKEKAEEIIDDLVKRGEMSEDDRANIVGRLLQEAEMQKDEFEEKVAVSTQKALTAMGLPTLGDYQNVLKRMEGIEKAIGTMKRNTQRKKS